ncbi:hypothetical protein ACFQ7O_35700 [Streptomyces sp. NPDC056485]|uniref:hypothetical protein n=1 Tax=Streptomyces sp. NPDC056485 TaxID=3345834 RepID=UPI0036B5C3E7
MTRHHQDDDHHQEHEEQHEEQHQEQHQEQQAGTADRERSAGGDRRTPTAERPTSRPPQLPYNRGPLTGRTAEHRRTVGRRR